MILIKLFSFTIIPLLHTAPSNAHLKNTLDWEKRSEIVKIVKISVPIINPNCTTDVKCSIALSLRSKFTLRLLITPLPANQSEVQQN